MPIIQSRDDGQSIMGEQLSLFENREILPPRPAFASHKLFPKPSGWKWKRPRGQGAGEEMSIPNARLVVDGDTGGVMFDADGEVVYELI